ncbi:MAG: EAL domain-containing protein [Lachnospiraceae bacterium]|nr:EAL domain-containing protein [Lachnospiraceae bacterium]
MDEEIKDAKVGGLRAVEMFYRGIREFASGDTSFLQSKTRLNTPDFGTLMPETYRKVAELSNQCISLFDLELRQVLETIKNLQAREFYFRWCSVYMPLRQLGEKGLHQKMMSKMDEFEVDTNRLCFELSPDVLVEGTKVHSAAIENLRNRGFHFMITEFGGLNSPLMRLAFFPVDYVMLSSEMIGYLRDDDRSLSAVGSIVEFAEGMNATTIADGVSKAEHAEMLYRTQCNFGAGPLAGNYVAERYLRKKREAE